MKLKFHLMAALLAAGLLITNSANAQIDWHVLGNSGTNTVTNFIGTIDNNGLMFRTNNQNRMILSNTGKLGIGTTTPANEIDVVSAGAARLGLKANGGSGAFLFMDKKLITDNATVSYRTNSAAKWQTGTIGDDNFAIYNFPLATKAITISASNNYVGIGTATPGYLFDVQGIPAATTPPINSRVNYVGSVDVRAIQGVSHPSDGWGYGVYGEGGWIGVYGYGNSATTSSFGLYGYASGGAGTQYGVYGSAYNSAGSAWAGYFLGNTYASNLVVGAGAPSTGYTLTVGGKIIATEVRVQLMPFPDYVFDKNYKLRSVYDVEEFINQNKHLPGMPTACDVEENGMAVGEMQGKLVEKVEEQTLYIIQMQKQIDELKKEIQAMKK